MKVIVVLAFIGIAVFLATNTSFSMLSLSSQYTIAGSDSERSMILTAVKVLIAQTDSIGGRYAGMPLVWLSGVIFSFRMLSGDLF